MDEFKEYSQGFDAFEKIAAKFQENPTFQENATFRGKVQNPQISSKRAMNYYGSGALWRGWRGIHEFLRRALRFAFRKCKISFSCAEKTFPALGKYRNPRMRQPLCFPRSGEPSGG